MEKCVKKIAYSAEEKYIYINRIGITRQNNKSIL